MANGNTVPPTFINSSDVDKILFNEEDNSARSDKSNTDVYPLFMNKGIYYTINPHSGSIGEDPAGNFPIDDGWVVGSKNTSMVMDIINEYPRHMLRHLVVVADEKGFPVPIAGPYFTKLLDHEPGTIQPLSCIITNASGAIQNLTITGNLDLTPSGDGGGTTAINTLGKANLIDCGFINDEED